MRAIVITNSVRHPLTDTTLANIAARLGVTECEVLRVEASDAALHLLAQTRAEWLDYNVESLDMAARERQERRAA